MEQRKQKTVPKICGLDAELGNFIVGDPEKVARYASQSYYSTGSTTCGEASRRLLREVDGVGAGTRVVPPAKGSGVSSGSTSGSYGSASHGSSSYGSVLYGPSQVGRTTYGSPTPAHDVQDWGRKFLEANGSCIYIDLDHLELCTPEVTSAKSSVAAWRAMLALAHRAWERAEAKMPDGTGIQVLVNNTDGFGNSYGSHLSFLMDRQTYSNMFQRRLHYLAFLASYQASSILFTGAGKVGSENFRPTVDFQLTQRADFFETLSGPQTTHFRPLVNARDEGLCGGNRWSIEEGSAAAEYARLHVIFYDNTLNQVASFLKVGVMQIILAMIEGGAVDTSLVLEDPVRAVEDWSHDVSLGATARTIGGADLTALEHQREFFEQARQFADAGELHGVVPDWELILDRWKQVLDDLAAYDLNALSRQVDWALKFRILDQVRRDRDLTWSSPEIKHLDQIYSNLDPEAGLFWAYEKAGLVDTIVTDEEVEALTTSPPEDTRAWGRTMLLRRAELHQIQRVDWDRIDFRELPSADHWSYNHRFDLDDPTRFTRAELQDTFDRVEGLPSLLDILEESNLTTETTEGDGS